MLLTEIKREVVLCPSGVGDDVRSLAEEAERVLGYGRLREALDVPAETPSLLKTLGELGIEILNRESVVTYMRQRMIDRTMEMMGEWEKSGPDPLSSWNSFSGARWDNTEVDKYKDAIPEFVINKAVQIKRALPEVKIYITHLTEDKDPFLKVEYGKENEWDSNGESYFIEVWEEPKFEGRM
jgi:hypothetical protein